MVHNLSEQNSIINRYVYELRSKTIQSDRMRFRRNVERIGALMAYEVSKTLQYAPSDVETPLGVAQANLISDRVILGSILRAGVTLHNGLLSVFDHEDNAFFSAYRQHHRDGTFEIRMDYITCPDLEDSILIVADPMVASGASVHKILTKAINDFGKPRKIHIVSVIASRYGIEFLERQYPENEIWAAVIDEELTAKSYIVPGLGDAGDLMFGPKLQE